MNINEAREMSTHDLVQRMDVAMISSYFEWDKQKANHAGVQNFPKVR